MIIAIINSIVKGIFGLVKQFTVPLTAFFVGKKSQELARLKKEAKSGKNNEKLRDGASRSDDNDLDDVLHD